MKKRLLSRAGSLVLSGTLLAWLAAAPASWANPTGGTVTAGVASIGTAGSILTVQQSTDRAVLSWPSFSVGAGETTRFVVPNASSATLNRVTGSGLSAIYGTLTSNGQLYLINPNGVLIGRGGVVNTAGFVASTLDVADSQFLAGGDLRFQGDSRAAVRNLGSLTATGGDVHLLARTVANAGTIAASGTVGLAGASQVLLQPAGQDKLFIEPAGVQGKVVNRGTIEAVEAELKADGGNAYALAIRNSGTIRATGSSTAGGRILLVAGGHGGTKNTGTLLAADADGKGGFIETSGERVSLAGTILTGEGGTWLVDPIFYDSSSYSVATVQNALDNNMTFNVSATNSISIDEDIGWTGAGTLILTTSASGGTITITGNISGINGGLTLTAGSSGSISDTGSVDVGTFTLTRGNWVQSAATLPAFSAHDFVLSGGTFLRVLGGTGTAGNPYLLTDIYGLQGVGGFLSSSFTLANDIDATGTANWNGGLGFKPIGSVNTVTYTGTFDGASHVINGLTIVRNTQSPLPPPPSNNYVGLFGAVGVGGTVKNVSLTAASVAGDSYVGILVGSNAGAVSGSSSAGTVGTAASSYVGGLVGRNTGTVTQSSNAATVLGNSRVGGLAGDNASTGTVSSSSNSGSVTGATYVGGLIGDNEGGHVTASHNDGAVGGPGGSYIGGLAGHNSGAILNSYNTGNVNVLNTFSVPAEYAEGGLVGSNDGGGSVTGSYSTGAVTGSGLRQYVGGLVGENTGTITTSYATGASDGDSFVGGLVGYSYGGSVTDSYSTGAAVATISSVGGLIGYSYGASVTDSYSTGAVRGGATAGGLVGYNNGGSVTDSYSIGAVSGTGANVGGLVGRNAGTVTGGYWATDASGQTVGIGGTTGLSGATGLILAEMVLHSRYAWNFAIGQAWGVNGRTSGGLINGGLPYFQWQYPTVGVVAASDQSVAARGDANLAPSGATYTTAGNVSTVSGISLAIQGANVGAGTRNALLPSGVVSGTGAIQFWDGTESVTLGPPSIGPVPSPQPLSAAEVQQATSRSGATLADVDLPWFLPPAPLLPGTGIGFAEVSFSGWKQESDLIHRSSWDRQP